MISRPKNGFKTPINRSSLLHELNPLPSQASHRISRSAQIVKVIGHIYGIRCQPRPCQDALRRSFQKENFFTFVVCDLDYLRRHCHGPLFKTPLVRSTVLTKCVGVDAARPVGAVQARSAGAAKDAPFKTR